MSRVVNGLRLALNGWRCRWLRWQGVAVGPGCRVGRHVSVSRGFARGKKGQIRLGAGTELSLGAVLHGWGGSILLDENVFVGPYAVIYGHGGVTVGRDTLIAMHCQIVSSNHTIPGRDTPVRSQPDVLLPTTIGRDVWLGAGVTVLGGVEVGDGCVVAAGAVVTENLPPYAVAVGVPARVVRYRS